MLQFFMKDKIYVLDTNIILQNLQNLYKISQNKINHLPNYQEQGVIHDKRNKHKELNKIL